MSELSVKLNVAEKTETYAESCAPTCDQLLMTRLQQGDETAMTDLVEQHGEMLARLVGRLTAWHDDREDILQEVLVYAWRKSGSFRADGSLAGWLRKMAINRCRNHFRTTSSLKRMIERFATLHRTNEPAYGTDNTEEDGNPEIHFALSKLSQSDRSVLVLFYLEELSGEQVATTLGIKPETVHVRLHRARNRMKKIMEGERNDRSL